MSFIVIVIAPYLLRDVLMLDVQWFASFFLSLLLSLS